MFKDETLQILKIIMVLMYYYITVITLLQVSSFNNNIH